MVKKGQYRQIPRRKHGKYTIWGKCQTGRSVEEIARDTERDNYLTAQEAMEYGLVDKVIDKR